MAIRALAALLALTLAVAACGTASPTPSPAATAASPTASAAPSAAGSPPASTSADDPKIATAVAFLTAIANSRGSDAETMEDATMLGAAPGPALLQLWSQLRAKYGAFKAVGVGTGETVQAYLNVTVPVYFEKATVPMIVTLDGPGKVAGLHLGNPGPAQTPGQPPASADPAASAAALPTPDGSAAPYVDPTVFTERAVTVGTDPWALPGTLSMPRGDGPFPAVVLVAGSGPNDRDETIGPNKPLRDLAWGLASQGIAVLRYDKRTLAYGSKLAGDASITVREEVIDDALAAVDLLVSTADIDSSRIYLAGHSLGGYLAPRIAAGSSGRLAGIAVLEAPTSPLEDLILAQVTYLASDAGGGDAAAAAQLPKLREQVALVKSASLTASTPAADLPLGIPAAYWLDLRGYDPAALAKQAGGALFISQGGRDYQVPPSELQGWRAGLGAAATAAIHEYPAMNHLLMDGSGPARPAEYETAGHVTADLVADLGAWVTVAR
jgi:uncharacterized protein